MSAPRGRHRARYLDEDTRAMRTVDVAALLRRSRPAARPAAPVRLEDATTAPTPAREARAVDWRHRVLPGALGEARGQLAAIIRSGRSGRERGAS